MMLLHTMKWRKSLLIIQISNYLVKNVEYKSKLAQKNQEARVAQGIFTYLSCSQRKIIKRLMVFLSSDYLKITCYLQSFFKLLAPINFGKYWIREKGKFSTFISFYAKNGNIEETSNACFIAIDGESKSSLTGDFLVVYDYLQALLKVAVFVVEF